MATTKQVQSARRNIAKARSAARQARTIAHLPDATRRDLGRRGAAARVRVGDAGRALEERNRQQLYELAKRHNIAGRSKMGKWELIRALRRGRD